MQFKLLMALLVILVPILLMILIGSISSINVVRKQVETINQNIINLYMNQIDDSLLSAYHTIGVLAVTDSDLSTIGTTANERVQYFAKYRLLTRLEDELAVYKNIFGFFVYSLDGTVNLERYQDSATYSEKRDIRNYIAALVELDEMNSAPASGLALNDFSKDWQVARIKDQYYLIRLFPYQNHIVGSCISIDNLVAPLAGLELGETGFILLTDQDNQPIYNTQRVQGEGITLRPEPGSYWVKGNQGRYLAVDSESSTHSFKLMVLFPERELMKGFEILIQVLLMISLVTLLFIPFGLYRINRMFLKPLRDLTAAMREIGAGNLKYRLDLKPHYDELALVSQTFNSMTDEINQLKIDVYEEQINKQKAELQYLQLQIRPHFLFNSLNVVYSLAQLKKYDLIKEMTMCLVSHFRYILRDGLVCVRFSEELEHIRNYLRIQEMRLPGTLKVDMQIDPGLDDVLIPPLVIHTLLENTVKHAIVIGETILVTLQIDHQVTDQGEFIHILLKDTGKGFSAAALAKLNQLEETVDFHAKNIGIQNIRHRIRFVFGEAAKMSFYNNAAGEACNEITLPIQRHSGS